jgi:hypothetical protein
MTLRSHGTLRTQTEGILNLHLYTNRSGKSKIFLGSFKIRFFAGPAATAKPHKES